MSRIFINYRRQDSEGYVGRLYDHLTQHLEKDLIFLDVEIKPGADFVEAIESAVQSCDVFLLVIGPSWLNAADEQGRRRIDLENDFVRLEIATALKHNKVIIPVLVGRGQIPSANDLPEDIRAFVRRNAVELSHNRFAYDAGRLVEAIKTMMPARGAKGRVAPDVLSEKQARIKSVRDDLVNATNSPLYQVRVNNRYFPVIGEGSADANIMFIGEAPGKTEAETGKPFCGPSGEVLDDMLRSINLKREDVFVTNLLLDRPPEKREPTPEELAFYMPFVDRLIDIIQPGVIVALGRFAMDYLLRKLDAPEKGGTITKLHGKLIKAKLPYGDIHLVPLYHPAVTLYNPSQKETLRQDFQKLKLFI